MRGPTTDTREATIPIGSFILSDGASKTYPWMKQVASMFSADSGDMANSQNTILTNGETYIPPDGVKAIGVDTLRYMNNKPREGGHSAIDQLMVMNTLKNLKPMYGGGEITPTNYQEGDVVEDKLDFTKLINRRDRELQEAPFDYTRTAGGYNRFLMQGGEEPLSNKDILIYQALQNPELGRDARLDLYGQVRERGSQFAKDASLTSALLNELGMEGISESDSLKLVNALSPVGKTLYDEYWLGKNKQQGGLVGYQEGDVVQGAPAQPQPQPQPQHNLQINERQANPQMYQGSTLGTVQEQVMMLQDSIEADTVNKARKTLELLKLKGLLENAEPIEYQNPPRRDPRMIPTPDESSQIRNMMIGNFSI